MNRIVREQPHECFAAYLDADGAPVQRQFHEMSPDEIAFAMRWHHDEAQSLRADLVSISAFLDQDDMTDKDYEQMMVEIQRRTEVVQKVVRLFRLVKARISGPNADDLLEMRLYRLSLN